MKLKLNRIISLAALLASVVAIILVLQKPASVVPPQTPAAIAERAKSFDQKMAEFEQATQAGLLPGEADKAEIRLNAEEISAVLAQTMGTTSSLTPNSSVDDGPPPIKGQQVTFEGDLVRGQFLTTVAGKDIWITISGHLGEKDGYATFDPTEFRVGDLSVPVSLVNPQLQKKMAEQRERLKLPEYVGRLKVENSQLIMQQR